MEEEDGECKKGEEWAKIQENTFTRWVNHQLQSAADPLVKSLKTDFVDGLLLIKLVETLSVSGRKVSRHNKKPTFRSQKLENVNIALSFLEADGLTLVNIDSTDIVDGKLKLILGLVWTLILHYSISAPMRAAVKSSDGQEESTTGGTGETPKQQLLGWIQDLLPGVTNLRKGWEDGRQVGALVDAKAPGLCPNWKEWQAEDKVRNATEAMNLADSWLGVAQLLTPEELVNPNVDELSMMTYLAQFREAKVKEGAPIQNQKVQLIDTGMEPLQQFLTKDAADDRKPTDVSVTTAKQPEELQRNNEYGDKPTFNPSSLFTSHEEDATKGRIASSLNLNEDGRRSCCSYILVVFIAVIVAFISTRQYDL